MYGLEERQGVCCFINIWPAHPPSSARRTVLSLGPDLCVDEMLGAPLENGVYGGTVFA